MGEAGGKSKRKTAKSGAMEQGLWWSTRGATPLRPCTLPFQGHREGLSTRALGSML